MRYVVGNSLSALSFAFYQPDCMLITSGDKRNIPFVYIQDNQYSRKLIKDLDMMVEIDYVRIIPVANLGSTVKRKGIERQVDYTGTERIANIGRDMVVRVLNISESALCSIIKSRLKAQARVREGSIKAISTSHIHMDGDGGDALMIPYSELIYTEHFTKFKAAMPSWDYGDSIQLHDLVFLEEEFNPKLGNEMRYYADGNKIKSCNNSVNKTAGTELRPDEEYGSDCVVVKGARFSGQLAPPPQNVLFVGRNATANPHWKIEDSIFVAQEGYGLCKMLYEQQRFDYHLQKMNSIKGHDRISGLILHVHSELGELLREVDWKMNYNSLNKKPIRATSILEEGIDIMKLVWAIFYHFQYTPREISEMFNDKSQRNWTKLLNEFYGGA